MNFNILGIGSWTSRFFIYVYVTSLKTNLWILKQNKQQDSSPIQILQLPWKMCAVASGANSLLKGTSTGKPTATRAAPWVGQSELHPGGFGDSFRPANLTVLNNTLFGYQKMYTSILVKYTLFYLRKEYILPLSILYFHRPLIDSQNFAFIDEIYYLKHYDDHFLPFFPPSLYKNFFH